MTILEIVGWVLMGFSYLIIVSIILITILLNWESKNVVESNKEDE